MFWKIPRIPSICPCLLVSPFSWLAQEINLQCLMVNTCPFPWKLGAVRGWVSHHSYRAYPNWWELHMVWATLKHLCSHYSSLSTTVNYSINSWYPYVLHIFLPQLHPPRAHFLRLQPPWWDLQFHGTWRAPREVAQQDRQRHLEFLHESSEQIWKDRSTGQVHIKL